LQRESVFALERAMAHPAVGPLLLSGTDENTATGRATQSGTEAGVTEKTFLSDAQNITLSAIKAECNSYLVIAQLISLLKVPENT